MEWTNARRSSRLTAALTISLFFITAVIACRSLSNGGEPDDTWRAELYPEDWIPGFEIGDGHFLHDFSYAGYHRGERSIPEAPPGETYDVVEEFGADPTGRTDSTEAIQNAVDTAGQAGGGVVELPEGTYRVRPRENSGHAAIHITCSGVVLRGQGPEKTRIFNDQTEMRGRNVIDVAPERGTGFDDTVWYELEPGSEVHLSSDAGHQADVVEVEDVSDFDAGEWIALRNDLSEEWVAEREPWLVDHWVGRLEGLAFYRRIVDIDEERNTITLDIPLRYALETRDNARVGQVPPHVEEIGIENLSVGMREHDGEGWEFEDYTEQGTAAWDVHDSYMIWTNHLVNGWIRNVHTFRPNGNDTYHLLSNGITLNFSRNVTIENTDIRAAQYRGGGGNGYGYVLRGSDSLVTGAYGAQLRYVYDFKSMHTTGNVVHASESRGVSDFHMHYSASNLIDRVHMSEEYFNVASRRDWGTVAHGRTTDQSVFWNVRGSGPGPDYVIDRTDQPTASYVIGTSGDRPGVRTAAQPYVQGIGEAQTLEPESLYEDQLERRIGP